MNKLRPDNALCDARYGGQCMNKLRPDKRILRTVLEGNYSVLHFRLPQWNLI